MALIAISTLASLVFLNGLDGWLLTLGGARARDSWHQRPLLFKIFNLPDPRFPWVRRWGITLDGFLFAFPLIFGLLYGALLAFLRSWARGPVEIALGLSLASWAWLPSLVLSHLAARGMLLPNLRAQLAESAEGLPADDQELAAACFWSLILIPHLNPDPGCRSWVSACGLIGVACGALAIFA